MLPVDTELEQHVALERLTRLQEVTAALAVALTPSQTAQLIVEQVTSALGACAGSAVVLTEGRGELELLYARGYPPAAVDLFRRTPLSRRTPISDAAREGQPVWLDSFSEAAASYPDLVPLITSDPQLKEQKAWAAVPLVLEGRILGVIGLSFDAPQVFSTADRLFVLTLARQCAQAVERARLYAAEVKARTEAQAARAEAERQRAYLHSLLMQLPIPVAVFNGPGHVFRLVNPLCQKLLRGREVLGLPLREVIPEAHTGVLDRVYQSGQGLSVSEWPVRLDLRGEGPLLEHFYSGSIQPVRDEAGRVSGIIVASVDVTELVRALRRLGDSEARLRRITESGMIGILFWEQDGLVNEANDALLRLLGYSREDLCAGRMRVDLLTPPEWQAAEAQAQAEMASCGVCTPYEKELWRKDGSRVAVLVGGAAFEDERRGGVAFVLDISERKRIAEFREYLLATVGHDLRSPLSAIKMSADALLHRDLGEREHVTLARIVRSAERMGRMIEQLLDLARSRLGGGIPVDYGPADMGEICRRITEELSASHPGAVLNLRIRGQDTRGVWDGDRLEEVVSNLVGNAIQHGCPDGVGEVDILLLCEVEEITLQVRNGGPPIPAEVLPLIFDPFRRGRVDEGGGRSRSLGLGLFIVQQIVVAHHGVIEARSSMMEGTLFTVRLPRRPPPP